jgi:hypothetical protein
MPRLTYFTLALGALSLGACNAIFGLDPTEVADDVDAAAGATNDDERAGGAGTAGAAGKPGSAGAAAGKGGAGTGGAAGTKGPAGAGGAAGVPGAAGAPGGAGRGGGPGGGEACSAPTLFEQTQDCSGPQQCKAQTIACADTGKSCEFRCLGEQSCEETTLRCPPGKDCRVVCGGKQACKKAKMVCGTGFCEIACTGAFDACEEMQDLECKGAQTCRVSCEGGLKKKPPNVKSCEDRDSSCPCEQTCLF